MSFLIDNIRNKTILIIWNSTLVIARHEDFYTHRGSGGTKTAPAAQQHNNASKLYSFSEYYLFIWAHINHPFTRSLLQS